MKNNVAKWVILAVAAVVLISAVIYFVAVNFGTTNVQQATEGDHDDIKVAAVGDSITYGLSVNNWSENAYPHQLADLLGEEYWVMNYGANNYAAMHSADFPYTDTQEYQDSLEFNPDIAVIMLGTNDSKDINWQGTEQFREEYTALIDSYIDNNSETEIYLATPPKAFNDASRPGDIDNENIDDIATVIKEVSAEKNTELIDINQLSEENEQWFEMDGIHPDAEGAQGIAEAVYQHIAE